MKQRIPTALIVITLVTSNGLTIEKIKKKKKCILIFPFRQGFLVTRAFIEKKVKSNYFWPTVIIWIVHAPLVSKDIYILRKVFAIINTNGSFAL